MIITKTPLRVSIVGGGTDYPSWSRKHGGVTVGGAINRFTYLTARFLPPFHDYKHRVVYREIETVDDLDSLRHKAVKAVAQKVGWPADRAGLEIGHLADLPARSGTGSSSAFVVGLLRALSALRGVSLLPHELAAAAVDVEQNLLGETVGCQDQTFAAHGGLNVLRFHRDGDVTVLPLALDPGHQQELEDHLLLFFTRLERTSSEVAATYAPSLGERAREQFAMMRLAEDGVHAIQGRDWERLGSLVDQSWRIKAGLSEAVTNHEVNRLYAAARLNGAFGGKLTGAGGGGCMVLVAPPEKHAAVTAALGECVRIPFRFCHQGSAVVFSDKDNVREYRPT